MNNYLQPFNENSYWNCKPINPILGTYIIPPCCFPRGSDVRTVPSINCDSFGTGVYKAMPTDKPMTIYAPAGTIGIIDVDQDLYLPQVVIKCFPKESIPSGSTDGHCDIVDEYANVIHSLWDAKVDSNGRWTAKTYSWAPLDGMGFGDPAHYYQGARAAGVPTMAGLIRKHEAVDGKPMFEHALACSLDLSGLSSSPSYVLPATISDFDILKNTGRIPEGALLMLPQDYDTSRLNKWPNLKKVAETLKVYGMRVVDRNDYSPFSIYVENGSTWKLSATKDSELDVELDNIRGSLREVVSTDGFLNWYGNPRTEGLRPNYMSLRGPWSTVGMSSQTVSLFNSLRQRLDLPSTTLNTVYFNANSTAFKVSELKPKAGDFFKFWVESDCSAKMNLKLKYMLPNDSEIYTKETGYVSSLGAVFLKWPAGAWYEIYVNKPAGSAGWVRTRFVKIDEQEYNSNFPKMS